MSKGGFQRVEPLGDGFIRGPARVLVCPFTYPYPTSLGKVINLATTGYTTEEQELTKYSAEVKKGTFNLGFLSYETAAIKAEATATEIQAALELLSPIGEGGVKCTEGPLKTKGVKIKFAGELAEHAQPLIVIAQNNLEEEKATFEVKRLTAGFGLYDPVGSWTELGATKGGIKIARNNTESMIDIDQIPSAILALPDEWEYTIEAPLAQTSLENIQLAWEGGEIKTDVTQNPNERHLGIGAPAAYEERRMAILHKKTVGTSAGKIRAHLIRRALHSPSTSTVEFQKTGNQQTLPLTFRSFSDPSVADPKYSFGEVVDQVPYV
jgi:hypothetical protein